jgi:ABC-type transporter Mla maintaining outer membrane lipid asymmetry ATPase subunit MlaF
MAGLLAPDKGDVIICGRKRHGLVSDEDISGVRIGLVYSLITSNLPNKYHDNFIDQLFSKILKWSLPMKVFQSAALFDSLTVRENVGFLL